MARPKKDSRGYYRATVDVGVTPDGKRIRKEIRSKSYAEYQEKLRAVKTMSVYGYRFEEKDTTVQDWGERWYHVYKKPHISYGFQKTIESMLRCHVYSQIGEMAIKDVRASDLQKLLNDHKGESVSHIQKLKGILCQMFSQAKRDGVIFVDVSNGLKMPALKEGTRRPLSPDEQEIFLDVARTHRAGLWILTMYYCGLRPEETVPLMWEDIDLDDKTLTIKRAAAWEANKAVIKNPKGKETKKGKAAERSIPIAPELLSRLIAAKKEAKGKYVFSPAESSGMLSQTNVRRLWKSFKRAVDLHMGAKVYRNQITESKISDELVPYCLRHTFASRLYEMGIDLKTAQYLLGHSDIRMTANIYTHFTDYAKANLKSVFDRYYNGGTKAARNDENIE